MVELALDLVQVAQDQRETVVGGHNFTASEEEAPAGGGWGAYRAGASVSRVDRTRPLHSAAVGEVCWFFASPTSPSGRYRLDRLTPSGDLFICAKYLFGEANRPTSQSITARPLRYADCVSGDNANLADVQVIFRRRHHTACQQQARKSRHPAMGPLEPPQHPRG